MRDARWIAARSRCHVDKWVEVTDALRARSSGGRLEFPNPSGGELPDPIFGTHKAIAIAYSNSGRIGLWVRRDDRAISLPEVRRSSNDLPPAEPTLDDLDYLKPLADEVRDLGVADLAKLEKLDLAGKYIDGMGLVHIGGLRNLRTLSR
jgi:hypothetical protein